MVVWWLRGQVKYLVSLIAGTICFAVGLSVLHLNPYWRPEPGEPGTLHHRVYAWNALGHLLCALGMLCFFAVIVFWSSRAFRTKWLYRTVIGCAIGLWIAKAGFSVEYGAKFAWSNTDGITEFKVQNKRAENVNFVWQEIVRLQIQDELNGYLGTSDLSKAEGHISVTVLRIVPIAVPTALGSGGQSFTTEIWKPR
jgi:hypothetical protein